MSTKTKEKTTTPATRRRRGRPPLRRQPRELPPGLQQEIIQRILRGDGISPTYRALEIAETGVSLSRFHTYFRGFHQSRPPRSGSIDAQAVDAFAASTLTAWRSRETRGFITAALIRMLADHLGVDFGGGGQSP